MIKLLIDAGNTRLKWCWYDGLDLPFEYESCEFEDFDEAGVRVFAEEGHDISEVLVCSVAGDEFRNALIAGFAEWGLTPEFLASSAYAAGVSNAYSEPGSLGIDRWVSLAGAWTASQDAVCIVDCGSAVTIDALDDNGQHLGGMIIPGLEMMLDALIDNTDGIDIDEDEVGEPSLLAQDTTSAVTAGTLYAVVALIDRVHQDISRELDYEELPLLLTGGDAQEIAPLLASDSKVEPMLVFHGMIALTDKEDEEEPDID